MARGRMLSKEISLDEKVNALSSDTARMLFTWLISHLDVEGRMYGDARTVKSIVVPRLHISIKRVEKTLSELEKYGLVLRYSLNGFCYLFAPNFDKHQTGLRKERETQSKIPPTPPELLRIDDGNHPPQVKVKDKYKFNRNRDTDNLTSNSVRQPKDDPDKYIKGKYGHMVRR